VASAAAGAAARAATAAGAANWQQRCGCAGSDAVGPGYKQGRAPAAATAEPGPM